MFSFVCTRLQIKWSQHVERILQMVACLVSGSRRRQQSLEKFRFVFWYFIIYLLNLLVTYMDKEAHINMYQVLHTSLLFYFMFRVFSHFLAHWHLLKIEWPHFYLGGPPMTLELSSSPYVWLRNFVILHNPCSSPLRVSDMVPSSSAMGKLVFEQTLLH